MPTPAESLIRIMLADDEASIRETATIILKRMGYQVEAFPSAETCLKAFQSQPADIVITDLRMQGMTGIDLLRAIKNIAPGTEVVIITAHADKDTAIEALKLGAFNFFEKPFSMAELGENLKRTIRYQTAIRERDQLAERLSLMSESESRQWGIDAMVGQSANMRKIAADIRKLQKNDSTSVLITGESGTGKELVARAIHYGSLRTKYPFIPVNCSAVPGELAESELFGHVKGSFTGATSDRKGCFERADRGTLFLDEIGDMAPVLQSKLLRVLEDGIITPVGGSRGLQTQVRIIAATNADLDNKIHAQTFRRDLFFRLARFTIHLPPLRERRDDIPLLVHHFLQRLSSEMKVPCPEVPEDTLQQLTGYAYPGNIRELRNMLERAMIVSDGKTLKPHHLLIYTQPLPVKSITRQTTESRSPILDQNSAPSTEGESLNLADQEKRMVRRALETAKGNVAEAARLLGINRTKLYRLMQMS